MATLAKSFMADFDDEDDDVPQQPTVAAPKPAAPAASAAAAAVKVKKEPAAAGAAAAAAHSDDEGDEQKVGDAADAAMQDGSDEDDDDSEGDDADAAAAAVAEEDASLQPTTDDPLAPAFNTTTPTAQLSALFDSDKLQLHLAVISHFQFGTPLPSESTAAAAAAAAASAPVAPAAPSIHREREYPYIVASNELSFEIDSHIAALHKLARDLYAPRYAELEQLLSNPVEYARVAQLISNETDMAKVTKLVQGGVPGVPNNVLLTISVTATTTRGKPLPEEQLARLHAVCDTILKLDAAKARMHSYISSRMSALAPNVSAMLGTEVAARLVALAGGIKKLSEMPACNLQNLGKRGKQSSGMSRIAQGVHDGLIVTSKVIQNTPVALRQRAMRLLAGKVVLAARLDSFGSDEVPLGGDASGASSSDGSKGAEFLADITAKIEKWQEPPPTNAVKALPVPLSRAKSRRGGKRHRKDRERNAVGDLSKQKKRMFFGREELVDEYTGEGLGMIGQEGTGILRVQQQKEASKLAKRLSQKTQARLSKKHVVGGAKAALAGLGTVTSLAAISGTASSIAFSPAQGMQLVKTESAATRAIHKASNTYFATNANFNRVKQDVAAAATPAAASAAAPPVTGKRVLPPVPSFSDAGASIGGAPDPKRQKI